VASRSRLVVSVLPLVYLSLAGCGGTSPAPVDAVRFDPCQPLTIVVGTGGTADRDLGVRTAADLWNQAAGAHLAVVDAATAAPPVDASDAAAPTLPLSFQTAADLSHGFFDPVRGQVLINNDLVARPLTVTIAHEVGHAFGLLHVSGRPSVMNAGNLDVEPNADDVAYLAQLWGRCGGEASQ
jgi:hypothetical protein